MELGDLEEVCMQLITFAGVTKSAYVEAMAERRAGNKDKALKLLKEGKESFAQCHKIHQQMFTRDFKIEKPMQNILLMHAEDQMMACEIIYILATELMESYARIENLENKR